MGANLWLQLGPKDFVRSFVLPFVRSLVRSLMPFSHVVMELTTYVL